MEIQDGFRLTLSAPVSENLSRTWEEKAWTRLLINGMLLPTRGSTSVPPPFTPRRDTTRIHTT